MCIKLAMLYHMSIQGLISDTLISMKNHGSFPNRGIHSYIEARCSFYMCDRCSNSYNIYVASV